MIVAWRSAASLLVQAEAARFTDTAASFQALGGGWWNRNDNAATEPRSPDDVTSAMKY